MSGPQLDAFDLLSSDVRAMCRLSSFSGKEGRGTRRLFSLMEELRAIEKSEAPGALRRTLADFANVSKDIDVNRMSLPAQAGVLKLEDVLSEPRRS